METETHNNLPAQIADPFKFQPVYYDWEPGQTVADILALHDIEGDAYVCINGHPIKREYWHVARPKAGTLITAKVLPQGGDNGTLRLVAKIGIAIAASFEAPANAGSLGFSTTGMAASEATTAVFAVGVLAVNALLPLDTSFDNGTSDSQTLSVGASRNAIQPFGTFPCLLGRHRIYPPQGALPFTEIDGADQYVTMLFVVGY